MFGRRPVRAAYAASFARRAACAWSGKTNAGSRCGGERGRSGSRSDRRAACRDDMRQGREFQEQQRLQSEMASSSLARIFEE